MNYTQAISAVDNGKFAWRVEWGGQWIYLFDSKVYITSETGPAELYSPSSNDESATDWFEGDRPPHP